MPNDPEISCPARRWSLRAAAACIVTLFALPVIAWFGWGWIEAARLDRALDGLEARHEPLDLADFDLTPTTPEQRAASRLYAEARKAVAALPIGSQQTADLARTIEQLCTPGLDPLTRADRNRVLLAFEERYAPIFQRLDRASLLESAGWADSDRPERQSMDEMQSLTLTRANLVRVARLACTGDADAAADTLLATLRLRRVWIPAPIPMQTAHSLHAVLTFGPASPLVLERIQRAYALAADEHALENWIARARAGWLYVVMPGVFSDPPPGYSVRRVTPLEGIATRLVRPLRDHRIVAELREYDEAVEVAKQPWPQKIDAVAAFSREHPANRSQSVRRGLLDELSSPWGAHAASASLTNYVGVIAEGLARSRASIGAIAVARYRGDHAGELPATLQQLIPTYVSAPLVDPYSGTELKYRHDAAGYKVYSVGANRTDDGGVWEPHSDLQTSRRGNPLDIGIAVAPRPVRRAN